MYKISYQGLPGSYSHQACEECYPDMQYNPYRSFYDAIMSVHEGTSDLAVLPVENSAAGRVMEVYNLLPEANLHIIREHLVLINHCLMVPKKVFRATLPQDIQKDDVAAWKNSPLNEEERQKAFSDIKEIHSHPQGIAQCRKYIKSKFPKAITRDIFDTAASARDISMRTDCDVAAIASKRAAEIYNMAILDQNIQDISTNTTRFLVFSKEAKKPEDLSAPYLTTLLFETGHEPGSLIRALQVFNDNKIDMTKLETYMSGPTNPNPRFYVDIAAGMHEDRMKKAYKAFDQLTENINVLGSYQASQKRGEKNNGFLKIT